MAGVLLAFALHHRASAGDPTFLRGYDATVAAVALSLVYVVPMQLTDPLTHERWGTLLPLYALLVSGLVDGHDPLAKLLGHWPLPAVGAELAYPVFMMQEPVRRVWEATFPSVAPFYREQPMGTQFGMSMLLLLPCGWLVSRCVNKPAAAVAKRTCLP